MHSQGPSAFQLLQQNAPIWESKQLLTQPQPLWTGAVTLSWAAACWGLLCEEAVLRPLVPLRWKPGSLVGWSCLFGCPNSAQCPVGQAL